LTLGPWTPLSFGPIRYIGLQRRPGAPPITRAGKGRADWPAYSAPAGIAAGAGRNISGFALDRGLLARAVTVYAPHVTIESGGAVGRPVRRGRRA
jgi:hypothetical protein